MPIYEFYCPDNHKIYSFFARSLAYAGKTPRCPDNPKLRMERMISRFAVTGRAKEKPDMPPEAGPNPDDPRMEAAMAEMEREFGGMASENPDPRQMARMMRKMTSLMGENVPGAMDEMLGRMEKGEDPEKLEEEYGDVLDDLDSPGEKDAEAGANEETKMLRARLRGLRRPRRDPALYEMSEFVD
jgi:hypothetical protein